jgi:polyadenylate-binding protein
MSSNVFIRNIPKNLSHADLQRKYEAIGKIKSLKVSLNADHTSRGYGFICFQDDQDAVNAVDFSKNDMEVQAQKFEPKDVRRAGRRLINNVYVKNIPLNMAEKLVKKMFSAFGNIKSLILMKNDIGQFGFVCYDDPKGLNKEYGPDCAQKAIDSLSGKDMGNDLILYVRQAMKKNDRELEKKKETLRYKASKKRCNLFIKNFPNSWMKDDIENLFKQHGEIESTKLDKGRNGNFAFVCFKQPDNAANAKLNLNNLTFEGKSLIINHYEIKEQRKLQIEDAIDKADFEKYQAQQVGSFKLEDLSSHPHMTQILHQLLDIMHQNSNFQSRGYNRRPNYQKQQYLRPMPPMPMGPVMIPMRAGPMPSSAAQHYMSVTTKLLPAVTERNPYLKEKVGEAIFPFIKNIVGNERVPKITGMLIELPVEQIK